MSSKCANIIDHLEELIAYLQPLLPLANFHMVDYFSTDVYKTFFPQNIVEEVHKVGGRNIINNIFYRNYDDTPHLKQFIDKSQQYILSNCHNVCLSNNDFCKKLSDWNCEETLRLKIKGFMTSKKSHEVDIMSYFCAAIRNVSCTSHLIDIGDGKGYLSSILAFHHGIPVLGIEASTIVTQGAIRRAEKLSKHWNKVVKSEESEKNTKDCYKQITKFVDEDTNLGDLVSNVFLERPKYLGLVGLHTCGNLAANCIKMFVTNGDIKTICNVGCCYHFISEEFDKRTDECLKKGFGFPLSNYVRSKQIVIGRDARMISAQSVERILDKKELPSKMLFYRALLEVLLDRKSCDVPKNCRQVGRFRKPILDFNIYVQKALNKIKLNISIEDEEINKIYNEYQAKENELNLFYLLRNMLAPAIESLILLDRLLYLHESGYENSYLVQMFDPFISPRCYGIIGLK